jgi:hypothetical protein
MTGLPHAQRTHPNAGQRVAGENLMKSVLLAASAAIFLGGSLGLSLLAASPVQAQEAMTGIGTTTCSDYNDARARVPDGLPDGLYSEDNLYVAWAQGFISALNAQAASQKKPLRVVPRVDAMGRAVRTACAAKPQAQFSDMLMEIYNAQPIVGKNTPSSSTNGG